MAAALHSLQAEKDLEEIDYQIAVTDGRPFNAERIVDEILAKCDFYAGCPLIGTAADYFFEGCRIGRHKRWVIFYRIRKDGIEVVRIVDGARDFPNLFR